MAKVGKFCLAKRVKVEWLFQSAPTIMIYVKTFMAFVICEYLFQNI